MPELLGSANPLGLLYDIAYLRRFQGPYVVFLDEIAMVLGSQAPAIRPVPVDSFTWSPDLQTLF